MEKYNGYKNYCTWAVKLWIDNDRGLYEYFREAAQEVKEEYADENDRKYYLAERVKDFVEENAPELPASMYSDLMGFALGEVDFREIAEMLLED